MDLRHKTPMQTYPYLVNTDGKFFYDGTGSMLSNVLQGISTNLIESSYTTVYNASVNQTVTLLNASKSHCNLLVDNKIYGGSWSRHRYVFPYPDSDLTNFTESAFPTDYASAGADFIGDAAYSSYSASIFYLAGSRIWKVEIDNFTSQSAFLVTESLGGVGSLPAIEASGGYLFVGTATTPPHFLKINIDTSEIVQDVIWTDPSFLSIVGIHASTMSPDKNWVYFATPGTTVGITPHGGGVVKVSTSDCSNFVSSGPIFKYIGNNPVMSGSFDFSDDICYLNGFIYGVSETGLSSGSLDVYGYTAKINADTLITSSTNWENGIQGSYGIFTDGTHLYKCAIGEGTVVYLNGDLNSPRRFTFKSASQAISPNEMWFTNERIVVSDWAQLINTTGIQWISFPITRVGIDKTPVHSLDVSGDIYASDRVNTSYINASSGLNASTIIFTSSIATNNNSFRVSNLTYPKMTMTGSITSSAGIFCPPCYKTLTHFHSSSINPTSSIAIKAVNSNNYFTLVIVDNEDGTGTLSLTRT